MPDTKITALTAIGANPIIPATFPIPMVDLTDTSMAASGTTKKVTVNQILGAGGTATLASATISGALTVNGSGRFQAAGTNWMEFGVNVLTSNQSTGANIRSVVSSAANPTYSWTGDSDTGLFTDTANSIGFAIGGSEGMRLNSTGLGVGIGPGYKLDVRTAPATASIEGSRISDATRTIISGQTGATYSYQGIGANQNVIYASGSRFDIVSDTQNLFLRTGTAAYVLLDTSGNVGIGVTPSAWQSSIYRVLEFARGVSLSGQTDSASMELTCNAYIDSSFLWTYKTTAAATHYRQFSGQHQWFNAPSGTAGNAITFTQAMTLDASGNLLVGVTSGTLFRVISSFLSSSGNGGIKLIDSQSNNTAVFANFSNGTGTLGSITNNNNAGVLYNVTSDKRLKENISDSESASLLIDSLQVRKFDWKANNSHQRYGFIAQELVTVVPEAVYQPTNSDDMMAVDYSKLVPMLVKEIQSLRTRVQTLEAR